MQLGAWTDSGGLGRQPACPPESETIRIGTAELNHCRTAPQRGREAAAGKRSRSGEEKPQRGREAAAGKRSRSREKKPQRGKQGVQGEAE